MCYLAMGDVALLFGAVDQILKNRVGKVEQRAIVRAFGTVFLQYLVLLRWYLDLACHESSQSIPKPRRTRPGISSRTARLHDL